MSILSKILDEYPDEGLVTVEGFDDALIGIWPEGRLVYSIDKIIEIIMSDGVTEEEAVAFYEFNIEGKYSGDHAPIYIKQIN
jgi:hypothetical protein